MQSLLGDAHLERLDHDGAFYIARWRKADGSVWLMLWTAEADRDNAATPRTFAASRVGDAIPLTLDATTPAVIHPKPVGPRPIFVPLKP